MNKRKIEIKEGSLEEAFGVHKQISEFSGNPPNTIQDFKDEIKDKKSLILVAYLDGTAVGYNVGYDKFKDGSFYSWMGGVISKYRRLGVYRKLKEYQEKRLRSLGYKSIKIKTWNRRVEMRVLLAKSGYNVVGFEEKPNILDNRLMHEKVI